MTHAIRARRRRVSALLALVTVGGLSSPASAVVKVWSPLLFQTDWHNSFNWSPNGVPTSSDDVIISGSDFSVTLSNNTASVNSLVLSAGATLASSGFTLNVQATNETGSLTIGSSSGTASLSLIGGAKAADIDILNVNSGGRIDLIGTELEIDNRLTFSAGGRIVGNGSIDFRGLGSGSAYDVLINNGTITAQTGTLRLIASGSNRLNLAGTSGSGRLIVGGAGNMSVEGQWSGAFTGELRNTGGGTFTSTQAWTANGSVNLAANGSRIAGGTMTLGGSMRVGTNATHTHIVAHIDAPFRLSGGFIDIDDGGINSSTTLRLNNQAFLNGGTITGSGGNVIDFRDRVHVTANTSINTFYALFATQDNDPDITINPGARLTLNANRFSPPGEPSSRVLDANVLINGGTLHVSSGFTSPAPRTIELRNGGRLTGDTVTVDWILRSIGSISSVVDAPINVRAGLQLNGSLDTPLIANGTATISGRVYGPTVFNNNVRFTSSGAGGGLGAAQGPYIVLNGGAELHNFLSTYDFSGLDRLVIAGNTGANSTLSLREGLNSKDVSIASVPGATGRAEATSPSARPWNVNGVIEVGGIGSIFGGNGTLQIGLGSTPGHVNVNQTVRVWPDGMLDMRRGELKTRHLVFEPGGTFDFSGGTITIDGGAMTFPSSSYGFGGTGGVIPTLRLVDGSDAAVQFGLRIGQLSGTVGRIEVVGTNPGGVPSTLRNFGGGAGADLIAGGAGYGEIVVSDGGLVSAVDDFVAGENSTGTGAAIVGGVVNGNRARLIADGRGDQSELYIGFRGAGALDVFNGGYVATTGDLFLAFDVGSTGSAAVYGAQGGFDAHLDITNDVVVGGSKTVSGGNALLNIFGGGRLDARDVIVRPNGVFAVSDGRASIRSLINTDNGTISLNGGTLQLTGGTSNFGTGTLQIGNGTGTVARLRVVGSGTALFDHLLVATDGRLEINNAVVSANRVTIQSPASADVAGGGRLSTGSFGGVGTLVLNSGTMSVGSTTFASTPVSLGSGGGTFDIAAQRSVTLSGTISGTGALRKIGSGTLVLTGANTYTGATSVFDGVLRVNSVSLPGNLANHATVRFNQVSSGTYAGAISGAGSLIKDGGGILTLNGNNTFTGPLTIAAGTLRLGPGDSLSDQTTVTVNPAATLDLASNDERFGALAGSGTVALGSAHMRVGINNQSTTHSGVITGTNGQLIKQGTGSFTLTAANTYTGGTTVEAGAMVINNASGSATGTGPLTVNAGATLGGSGSVGGAVNVLPGATVSPGLSPGTISVPGITFNPNSFFDIEISDTDPASHDRLDVSGLAVLSGSLNFQRIGGFQPLPGDFFDVVFYGSRIGTFDQISGSSGFAGLSLVPEYQTNLLRLRASGLGGDANLDGVVNLQDFNVLAANFGSSSANWLTGDFNGDGLVNLADFNILAANFGVTASAAGGPTPEDWSVLAAVVPEPSMLGLAVVPVLAAQLRRRRR